MLTQEILERLDDIEGMLRRLTDAGLAPPLEVCTVKEVARQLGRSEKDILEMSHKGDFPGAFRVGRAVRIPQIDVMEYQRRNLIAKAPTPPKMEPSRQRPPRKNSGGYIYTAGDKVVGDKREVST